MTSLCVVLVKVSFKSVAHFRSWIFNIYIYWKFRVENGNGSHALVENLEDVYGGNIVRKVNLGGQYELSHKKLPETTVFTSAAGAYPEPLYNVCPSATSRLRSAGFADRISNKKSLVPRTHQFISVREKNYVHTSEIRKFAKRVRHDVRCTRSRNIFYWWSVQHHLTVLN